VCSPNTDNGISPALTDIGTQIDYLVAYDVALEPGGWLVGDDIHISVDLEIVKQPETEPVAAMMAQVR
jgi:hypothetical protein